MVKSGEVFPANFPDKGPEQPLRLARLFTGLQPVRICDIDDKCQKCILIDPSSNRCWTCTTAVWAC